MTLLALLAAALLQRVVNAATARVSNVAPRVDAATGKTLDIHDGNTLRIGDEFYWFGASYGLCTEMATGCASVKVRARRAPRPSLHAHTLLLSTLFKQCAVRRPRTHPLSRRQVGACGFNMNHTVSLAVSSDLVTWSLVGTVLPVANRPTGILFSPWVARSAATGLYVMWYNMLPTPGGQGDFDAAYYAIATSASPRGPFTTVAVNVTGIAYARLPDAPSIFVDDDGAGYIAFTHEDTHVNHVQQLTPDLLGPLPGGGVSAQIGGPNNEGVVMFKHAGLQQYFVMFGQCCCFVRWLVGFMCARACALVPTRTRRCMRTSYGRPFPHPDSL